MKFFRKQEFRKTQKVSQKVEITAKSPIVKCKNFKVPAKRVKYTKNTKTIKERIPFFEVNSFKFFNISFLNSFQFEANNEGTNVKWKIKL